MNSILCRIVEHFIMKRTEERRILVSLIINGFYANCGFVKQLVIIPVINERVFVSTFGAPRYLRSILGF